MPRLRDLYQIKKRPYRVDRATRRGAATAPSLDDQRPRERGISAEETIGRAGVRNHQGADGRPKIPAARADQRGCLVDRVGHRFQLKNSLAPMARRSLPTVAASSQTSPRTITWELSEDPRLQNSTSCQCPTRPVPDRILIVPGHFIRTQSTSSGTGSFGHQPKLLYTGIASKRAIGGRCEAIEPGTAAAETATRQH